MAEEEHTEAGGREVARLAEAVGLGALSVVEGLLSDPRVQALVRRALARESARAGLAFASLLAGLMMTYHAVKAALGCGWPVDLAVGLPLLALGALHLSRRAR